MIYSWNIINKSNPNDKYKNLFTNNKSKIKYV